MPACEKITGWTREQSIGRTTTELGLWKSSEERASILAGFDSSGKLLGYCGSLRRHDGTIGHMEMNAWKIEQNGESLLLTVVHDTTETEGLRQKAAQATCRAGPFDGDVLGRLRGHTCSGLHFTRLGRQDHPRQRKLRAHDGHFTPRSHRPHRHRTGAVGLPSGTRGLSGQARSRAGYPQLPRPPVPARRSPA